jgi:hypothetical protein
MESQRLVHFLLGSKENANENQQAQILFLLHLSKSNLGFIIYFVAK